MLPECHEPVEVESFALGAGQGSLQRLGLRPMPGQKFSPGLLVQGNKSLVNDYPVGTRFKVQVALMTTPTGSQYLFSSWQWDTTVLALPI